MENRPWRSRLKVLANPLAIPAWAYGIWKAIEGLASVQAVTELWSSVKPMLSGVIPFLREWGWVPAIAWLAYLVGRPEKHREAPPKQSAPEQSVPSAKSPMVTPGATPRELVKEWYYDGARDAYEGARDLLDKVANKTGRGPHGELLYRVIREHVVAPAWNYLSQVERMVGTQSVSVDHAVLLEWAKNYRTLWMWAANLSRLLQTPVGEIEHYQKWKQLHQRLAERTTALLARDAFDSLRSQSLFAEFRNVSFGEFLEVKRDT